jgi:hypothetical protein
VYRPTIARSRVQRKLGENFIATGKNALTQLSF